MSYPYIPSILVGSATWPTIITKMQIVGICYPILFNGIIVLLVGGNNVFFLVTMGSMSLPTRVPHVANSATIIKPKKEHAQLPCPPYIKDTHPNSHVWVFKGIIKGNGETKDKYIVDLFMFAFWNIILKWEQFFWETSWLCIH
jgi:hypothetical protein